MNSGLTGISGKLLSIFLAIFFGSPWAQGATSSQTMFASYTSCTSAETPVPTKYSTGSPFFCRYGSVTCNVTYQLLGGSPDGPYTNQSIAGAQCPAVFSPLTASYICPSVQVCTAYKP